MGETEDTENGKAYDVDINASNQKGAAFAKGISTQQVASKAFDVDENASQQKHATSGKASTASAATTFVSTTSKRGFVVSTVDQQGVKFVELQTETEDTENSVGGQLNDINESPLLSSFKPKFIASTAYDYDI